MRMILLNEVDQTQKTLRTSPEGVKNRDELKTSVTGTLSFMSKIIRHTKVTKIMYFVEYAVFIFIHAQMFCVSAPKTNKKVTQGPNLSAQIYQWSKLRELQTSVVSDSLRLGQLLSRVRNRCRIITAATACSGLRFRSTAPIDTGITAARLKLLPSVIM